MALLPKKVGSMTLVRALSNDGVCQAFTGILDAPAGTQVRVRQLLPSLARDSSIRATVRQRLADLTHVDHPGILPILEVIDNDEGLYIVQEWRDTVPLSDMVTWARDHNVPMPLNIFLDVAVQICNAIEGLHGQAARATGMDAILHLDLRPEGIHIHANGRIVLSDLGLLPGPTFATQTGGFRLKTAYLSPEQTHYQATQHDTADDTDRLQRLSTASDLFSLGAVLYELLVQKPMFQGKTPLRTIAQVRRAEVTTQLLEVKEIFPGADRILYRALSLNPRHRYQRAFVLREDLRGLMAQFSFSDISGEARSFLEPLFRGTSRAVDSLLPRRAPPSVRKSIDENEPTVLAKLDLAAIRQSALNDLDVEDAATEEASVEDARTAGGLVPTSLEAERPPGEDMDGDATGVFDPPADSLGPMKRPVSYAADHDPWQALRDLEAKEAPKATSSEPAQPPRSAVPTPAPEPRSSPVTPTAVAAESSITRTGIQPAGASGRSVVLGALLVLGIFGSVLVCAGGGVLLSTWQFRETATPLKPAVQTRAPLDPRIRRWRLPPVGSNAVVTRWEDTDVTTLGGPDDTWNQRYKEARKSGDRVTVLALLEGLSSPAATTERALHQLDQGEFRSALRELDNGSVDDGQQLRVLEMRALAHQRLFERVRPPDESERKAAVRAWRAFAGAKPHSADRTRRSAAHLKALRD